MSEEEKVDHIFSIIDDALDVDFIQIKGRSRKQEYVMARMIAVYLIFKYTGLPDGKIALYINKDRTTVLYYKSVINNVLSNKVYDKKLLDSLVKAESKTEIDCQYRDNLKKARHLVELVTKNKDLDFETILAQYLKEINYENKISETC